MGAVANDNRVELTVDSEVFHKAVRIIVDRDEIMWLGFDPFSQIGMFQQDDVPALLAFCAGNSEYHIVTYTSSDCYVNRFVLGQHIYMLAKGDKNPYLAHNPWINPMHHLIEEDVFSQLGCEPDQIRRRRKPKP
jgi:hypothetical protein